MNKEVYKNVAIPKFIHTELKIESSRQDMNIMEFARDAINRYIPRKPNGLEHNMCAVCDSLLTSYAQYCNRCGQRINWE